MQLASALPPNIDKYEAIFMPVNDGKPSEAYSGSHWSIMVYVRAVNSFYYYDTLKFTNLRDGDLTSKRIRPLLKVDTQPQFIPSSTPQQGNSSDCGGKSYSFYPTKLLGSTQHGFFSFFRSICHINHWLHLASTLEVSMSKKTCSI